MNNIQHILGVESSPAFNMATQRQDYMQQIIVSQDVYDWLNLHDLEYTADRKKVFICNSVRYVDLGIKLIENLV